MKNQLSITKKLKLLKALEKGLQEDKIEEFYDLVGQWVKSGEITKGDIEELSKSGSLKLNDIIQISIRIQTNPEGMTFAEARDLAGNYHFMLLTVLQNDYETPPEDLVQETFRKYEKMVEEIFHGREPKENVDFLRTLPSWNDWDAKKGYKLYKKSPYYDKPRTIRKNSR